MTRRRFSMHQLNVWEERSGDPRIPQWLRVTSLAYGMHDETGHTRFLPGQVGLVLGHVDPITGQIVEADKANVQRAIRKAVEFGWLASGSGSLCLIVPEHAVSGGRPVNPRNRCHHFKTRAG